GNILVAEILPRNQGRPHPRRASAACDPGLPDRHRSRAGARLDCGLVPEQPGADPTTGDDAVVVRGLTKSYRGRAAVRGLDLVAPRGRVTAVLGPNGAGKTTTVECCEGLRRPDGGT